MTLTTRPLLTYRADLLPPQVLGNGPYGQRQIFVVTGGKAEGDRVSGELLPGGGDWLLVGPDGFGRLDVRGTLQTSDGALVLISYHGLIELTERALQALTTGPSTEYGEVSFITAPRFETGDPRYAWLNSIICVAQGRLHPGPAVEYDVYEVVVA